MPTDVQGVDNSKILLSNARSYLRIEFNFNAVYSIIL